MPSQRVEIAAPVELDHLSVAGFAAQLEAMALGTLVLVDCSSVEFMDSAGVRALGLAADRQRRSGGDLVVVEPTPVVRRLLEITSLTTLLGEGPAAPADDRG